MKKIMISVCSFAILLLCGCSAVRNTPTPSALEIPSLNTEALENETMTSNRYYTADDFATLVAGKSTYHDLCEIAMPSAVHVTSYGLMCEYPMRDEKVLSVKLQGSNFVLWEIEIGS